jgi:hypothetical protein
MLCAAVAIRTAAAACPVSRHATHANDMTKELRKARATSVVSTTHSFPEAVTTRAGNRVRTDDLLITNQLLYQLSYAGFY